MWYFAYGTDLNPRSVAELCRESGLRAPAREVVRAAVLPNFRLCFPTFQTRWAGGVADIAEAFGKSVYGGLIEITPDELETLATINDRRLDPYGREVGMRTLVSVRAETIAGQTPVEAWTFRRVRPEYRHVPPSRHYVDRLVDAAVALRLSAMWVMFLRSLTPPDGAGSALPPLG